MTRTRRIPRAETLEDRRLLTVAFAPATSYTVADGAIAEVTGDFNGDGFPDVVTLSPQTTGPPLAGTVTTLLGNGRGGFTSVLDTQIPLPFHFDGSLAAGDFNGDGKLDLVSTESDAATGKPPVVVLLGNGDGTFRVGPTADGANAAATFATGDFNGDGVDDFAVAFGPLPSFAPTSGPVRVYLGQRNDTLIDAGVAGNLGTTTRPFALVAGDFNGDGKIDLAGSTFDSPQVKVLLGNGNGTFRDGGTTPLVVGSNILATADFNGDGKADLAALDPLSGGVVVLISRGDGSFSGGPGFGFSFQSQSNATASFVAGDFNGDGKADLADLSYPLNEARIATGNGSGGFGPLYDFPVATRPGSGISGLVATDLNRDGLSDLVTLTANPSEIGILLAIGGSSGGGGSAAGDGPRVTSAKVDPRSGRIVLTFGDDAAGLDAASLANLANYEVIGPYSQLGRHPAQITGVGVSPATSTGATTVTLSTGGRAFPHGRYILLVKSGGIVDRAGRALDGEFTGVLPSGNGIPGGDFQARFQFNRKALRPLAGPVPTPTPPAPAARAHARSARGGHR